MLSTDETIVNILLDAKTKEANPLLQYFKIGYASNQIAEESNSIFVASVDSQSNEIGFDYQTFTDRVEILIVTKNREYQKAINVIKTVSREIIRLILEKKHLFDNKPVIERITPEYNRDYVLTRGHIMVQVRTTPDSFDSNDEVYNVCKILTEEMDVEIQ